MSSVDIMRAAIAHYGAQKQEAQLIEEMSELIHAISKLWRNNDAQTRAHVIEEVADVEIMLEQLKMILNISPEKLTAEKNYKLQRLAYRLGLNVGAGAADICVCCGRKVPEGRQVCLECERRGGK